jgi:hypothetical protein
MHQVPCPKRVQLLGTMSGYPAHRLGWGELALSSMSLLLIVEDLPPTPHWSRFPPAGSALDLLEQLVRAPITYHAPGPVHMLNEQQFTIVSCTSKSSRHGAGICCWWCLRTTAT